MTEHPPEPVGCALEKGELMVEADGVSRFGLHRRHVIRYGERVSDTAIEDLLNEEGRSDKPATPLQEIKIEAHPPKSVGCAIEIIAVVRYVEEGLGLHHLRIYWRGDGHGDHT